MRRRVVWAHVGVGLRLPALVGVLLAAVVVTMVPEERQVEGHCVCVRDGEEATDTRCDLRLQRVYTFTTAVIAAR